MRQKDVLVVSLRICFSFKGGSDRIEQTLLFGDLGGSTETNLDSNDTFL